MSEGLSDEAGLHAGYEAMFGSGPDMVTARIRFVGKVAPRFQTLTEALRSDALGTVSSMPARCNCSHRDGLRRLRAGWPATVGEHWARWRRSNAVSR